MSVVDLLKSSTSQDQLLMHLLRCLAFYSAYLRFQFLAVHVPGIHNTAADALSRNNMSLFAFLVPQGQQILIPPPVLNLLVHDKPNCGSQTWTHLFTLSLTRGSPQRPDVLKSITTYGHSSHSLLTKSCYGPHFA